jgi:hypothetical protein
MTPEGTVTFIDILTDNIAFKGVVDVSVFDNAGVKKNSFAETIRLYPNLSDGIFTVNNILYRTEVYRTTENRINIADQAAGVCFLVY